MCVCPFSEVSDLKGRTEIQTLLKGRFPLNQFYPLKEKDLCKSMIREINNRSIDFLKICIGSIKGRH